MTSARHNISIRKQNEEREVRGSDKRSCQVSALPTELTDERQDENPIRKRGKVKRGVRKIMGKVRRSVRCVFEYLLG